MAYADVINDINTFIVTNGNNEITADVLNPVLIEITDFANDTIGDLSTLTTTDTTNIVKAINSLKANFNDLVNTGIQLTQGFDDPNITPPLSYGYADFYMQVDIMSNPIQLWQYTGTEWSTQSSVYSKAEVDLMVANIYAAIAALPSTTQLLMEDYNVTLAGTQDFTIPTGYTAKQVYLNGAMQFENTANNIGRTDLWSQTGDIVTLVQATEVDNYIQIFYQ